MVGKCCPVGTVTKKGKVVFGKQPQDCQLRKHLFDVDSLFTHFFIVHI